MPSQLALGFEPVVKGSEGGCMNAWRPEDHVFVALGFVVRVGGLQGGVEGLAKGLE